MKNIYLLSILWGVSLLTACAQAPTKVETVFYPMPPQTPRVQFLTTITKEDDLGKKSQFQEYLLGKQNKGKRLARPYAIAHEKGKIYIADKTIKKIIIIDLVKRSFDYIKDEKAGALQDPTAIYITDDGYKYVADAGREQIVVFDGDNNFYRSYGAEKQFRPTSVAVYGNRIYVCDIRDSEIEVLDKQTGELIEKIGRIGTGDGEFHKPTHIAVDNQGNLYVTDAFNFRVQKFDKDGKFVEVIGYQGSHPGAFARPKGLAPDRDGHLYVVDAAFEVVQIFDIETAEPLLSFGKYSPAPGSTYLPAGIHIDYDNVEYFTRYVDPDFKVKYLIYVGSLLGEKKLNIYGFGDWTGPALKYVPPPKPASATGEAAVVSPAGDIRPEDQPAGSGAGAETQ